MHPPSESVAIWNLEVGRRLAAAGHEVAIWGPQLEPGPMTEQAHGIRLRRVGMVADWRALRALAVLEPRLPPRRPLFSSSAFYAGYALRVATGVRAWRADAVHVHNFTQWVPVLRRARPPAVVALHMHCEWLSALHRATMARRAGRADVVLGVSEHISALTRAALPQVAGRCVTVANGVDLERFAPRVARTAGSRLVAVGRISPEKGVHRLLEAFERVQRAHPAAELELVGGDSPVPRAMLAALYDDPVLRALGRFDSTTYLSDALAALSPAARARVQLAGDVPHDEVPARLAAADVLVAASLTEAFGMPLVEAMAAGLPVVAAEAGAMGEIVRDGLTGLLVPRDDATALAEAIGRLLTDDGLRARLGAAGRKRAEECYSWDTVAEGVLAAYAHRGAWDTVAR